MYENLGKYYLTRNANQAYLCYENAEFLCDDAEKKELLSIKKNRLMLEGNVNVRKAAFIILSYNNMYLMQKCLESIRQYCAPEAYSVIIVDNASTDGVTDWLKQQQDIILLLSDENLGFPAGCNVAMGYADSEQDIFLLNNDTRMTHNALFWLRMGLYENDHIGATGAMVNYCGIDQLDDVFFSLPGEYVDYARTVNVPSDRPYEEKNRLGGFAMLIRREALEKTGTMDEAFSPGYFEDTDLSMRIHAAGYRLLVCHNSFIYHAGSQSFRKRKDLEAIHERNHAYMTQKWGYDSLAYAAVFEAEFELIQQISHAKKDFFRVLEVGAGSGNALTRIKYLYPNAEVFGVENSVPAVQNAVETVSMLCLDWKKERLPFTDSYFDYIIYNDRWGEGIAKEKVCGYMEQYLKENGKIMFVFE